MRRSEITEKEIDEFLESLMQIGAFDPPKYAYQLAGERHNQRMESMKSFLEDLGIKVLEGEG